MFADEADAHMLQIYGETLIFLAREGFIRHEGWSTSEPIFFEAVSLTGKGRAILNSTPDALKETVTLGQKLGNVSPIRVG